MSTQEIGKSIWEKLARDLRNNVYPPLEELMTAELPDVDAATDRQVPEVDQVPEELAAEAEYPADHKPGMRVPKGGSSCSSCEYLKEDGTCGNEFFIKWNGSGKLPAPPDEYCSDWYEPKDSE